MPLPKRLRKENPTRRSNVLVYPAVKVAESMAGEQLGYVEGYKFV